MNNKLTDFVNQEVRICIAGKGFRTEVSGILRKDGFEYNIGSFHIQECKANKIEVDACPFGTPLFVFNVN